MDYQAKEEQDNMSFPVAFGALINTEQCSVKYAERYIARL